MQNSFVRLDSEKLLKRLGKHLLSLFMLFQTPTESTLFSSFAEEIEN